MRAARERKGLSRALLGDFLGGYWSDKQIKHWEDTNPPEHLERSIREVLDMPVTDRKRPEVLRTSSGVRFGRKDMTGSGTRSKMPTGFDQKRTCGHSGDERCDQIRNEEGELVITENVKRWARMQRRVTNKAIREAFDVDEDEADEIYRILKRIGIVGRMGYIDKGLEQ